MKTKKITIVIIILILILLQVPALANQLTLELSVDKEKIRIDDEIKIKVSWTEKMQAADFFLNYDTNKVDYIKSDLDEIYVTNNEEEGKIKTAWISLNDVDKTDMEYTFKVKKAGKVKFTTKIDGGFASGKLEIPTSYNEGELKVNVLGDYTIMIISTIIIIIILIIIFLKKLKRRK